MLRSRGDIRSVLINRSLAKLSRQPLPPPPRSEDRTQSPAAVSRKREHFKYERETIGDFGPAAAISEPGDRWPIRKSPPLAGISEVTKGKVFRRQTAWLGREDSNLRMVESKSTALPLGDAPTDCLESRGTTSLPADSLSATPVYRGR